MLARLRNLDNSDKQMLFVGAGIACFLMVVGAVVSAVTGDPAVLAATMVIVGLTLSLAAVLAGLTWAAGRLFPDKER